MPVDTEIFGKDAATDLGFNYSDSDIFKDSAPDKQTQTKPAPSTSRNWFLGDNPIRSLALGSRAVAEGAMTLPMIAGDALNNAVNYGIKGANYFGAGLPYLPTLTQSVESALNSSGAPQPTSPSEKFAYQVNRGGAAGAAFPPLMSNPIAPALQAVSGAVSGGVDQYSQNQGTAPWLAGVYGAGAGMVIPTSPDVAGIVGRGSKAIAQPFYSSGREELVGNALTRMATRPRDALMNMSSATDDVSRLTTAQAAKDPGLLSTERGLANLPGSGGRFAYRAAEQNEARQALLNSISKSEADLARAKANRSADAERLYEPAFNAGPLKPTEELIAISKRPAFEQAAKKAMEIAGNEGLDLGSPLNTMRGLHYLKKGVDDLVENAKPGTNEMRALVKMKNDLLGVMDDLSPAYKTAREDFAKQSKPINQMEILQELKQRSMNSGLDVNGNRILSQAKWTNAVEQNSDELKRKLSPEQLDVVRRISKDLDYGKLSEMGGRVAGSNTFQNLSVANVLGAALGKGAAEAPAAQSLLRPLGFMFKLPERQVEELMIEAMLDKNLAMRLMSKANQQNVQALASGLYQRFSASTRGAIAGQVE